ncbi:MAG: ester cyclase [Pseudomonadota bacterium]
MDFQAEKALVLDHFAALDRAEPETVADALRIRVSADYRWRGFAPFGEQSGLAIADVFWTPFKSAMTALQRRQDIFFAGLNEIDRFQTVWVCSMGHLMGLFDRPWLDIRPTGKLSFLRYAEFNRVEAGKIAETAMFFDIPHFMAQAGQSPFAAQTGQHLVQPGPADHGGLLSGKQDPEDGAATLALINSMIRDLGTWESGLPLEEELAQTWRDDMLWWGPEGIGATYTIERYAQQHAAPFRAAFSDRSPTNHVCRIAEGKFGGFFGWPNFSARMTGPFMGCPPTGQRLSFNVIDIYRREQDRLAENWVFIDLMSIWRAMHGESG